MKLSKWDGRLLYFLNNNATITGKEISTDLHQWISKEADGIGYQRQEVD
jgi:hypothetical protein